MIVGNKAVNLAAALTLLLPVGLASKSSDVLDDSKPKVFGLGLSKHATSSMAKAMELVGYENNIHTDRRLGHFMHHAESPANLTGWYDDVDSVWDIPTAAYYQELHKAYPDAKFVLTTRDSDEWLTSFEHYLNEYQKVRWGCVIPERVQRLHEFVYGSRELNPSWIDALEEHNAQVIEYFEDYPDQLLVMDIHEQEDIWGELCTFLDAHEGPCRSESEMKSSPFPKTNTEAMNTANLRKIDTECPTKETFAAQFAPKSSAAYVMLQCDPEGEGSDEYLRMAMVLSENIREYDTDNDIVLLIDNEMATQKKMMLQELGIKVIRVNSLGREDVLAQDPFHQMDDKATRCYNTKFRAMQLLQYDRVMFVDSDIVFNSDPRFLFNEPGFVIFSGSLSPVNGGLFVFTPSQQVTADLQDIVNSGSFDAKNGWLGYGAIPDWQSTKMHDWTFWGAHTDQGLLYYYYHVLKDEATVLQKSEFDWLFSHFAGKNKPFLMDRTKPKTIKKRFRAPMEHWFALWDVVEAKIGKDVASSYFGLENVIQINADVMNERLLGIDPYETIVGSVLDDIFDFIVDVTDFFFGS